jgi:hypothetical protein
MDANWGLFASTLEVDAIDVLLASTIVDADALRKKFKNIIKVED